MARFMMVVVLFLSGCAASGGVYPNMQRTQPLARDGVVSLHVTNRGGASSSTIILLREAVQSELLGRRVFRVVKDDGSKGDVNITLKILRVKEVDQGTRSYLGAFAGSAQISVQVLVHQKGHLIDSFLATAESSSGTVMSGTTRQAVEIVASQIANQLSQ